MSDKVPLNTDNKIYSLSDLKPKFIIKLQDAFRKFRLKIYKNKKVKESKTPHQRHFYMKFRLNIDDDTNPQVGESEYEIIVPARAAFFAKMGLERNIIKKIRVEIIDWEELTDEEHEDFNNSRDEHIKKRMPCQHKGEQMALGKNKFHCMDCHEEYSLTTKD